MYDPVREVETASLIDLVHRAVTELELLLYNWQRHGGSFCAIWPLKLFSFCTDLVHPHMHTVAPCGLRV